MNVCYNTLDGLDIYESFSYLHLNNTSCSPSNDHLNDNRSSSNDRLNNTHRPHPNYRRPNHRSNNISGPFTHRSNNTPTFNDNDNFIRSNTPNNTSLNNNTFVRSTVDSNDNDMLRTNNNTSFRLESTPFHMMDNVHQVCSWLCKNPNVLLLAYNMYLSMQATVANKYNFISSNFNSSKLSAIAGPQEDKV